MPRAAARAAAAADCSRCASQTMEALAAETQALTALEAQLRTEAEGAAGAPRGLRDHAQRVVDGAGEGEAAGGGANEQESALLE